MLYNLWSSCYFSSNHPNRNVQVTWKIIHIVMLLPNNTRRFNRYQHWSRLGVSLFRMEKLCQLKATELIDVKYEKNTPFLSSIVAMTRKNGYLPLRNIKIIHVYYLLYRKYIHIWLTLKTPSCVVKFNRLLSSPLYTFYLYHQGFYKAPFYFLNQLLIAISVQPLLLHHYSSPNSQTSLHSRLSPSCE